jgi:hypothetical protein
MIRTSIVAGVAIVLLSCPAALSAQTPSPLATPTGAEANVSLGGYKYVEPSDITISMHGFKFGGEFTGTIAVGKRRQWFVQGNARGVFGNTTYTGFCRPWLIRPNSASPNGYELDLGDASPCTDSGDKDWYVETRGLIGRDLIGATWAFAPYSGVGYRHLSNGTGGTPGYRTDDYLYVPIGLTARTEVASHHALSLNVEYDIFARGWQNTYNTKLGGGTVPATATAPAFVINGLSDVAFNQHGGWALRVSGKYAIAPRWWVEPFYIRWNVDDSPVNDITATFTVNNITAHEAFGAYEPKNYTNEFGVKVGLRFK